MLNWLIMWFDDWQSILKICVRCLVCFIGLIVLLRLGGKRTLTKMNAFDFIMTFTIGGTLATVITSKTMTIAQGMAALASVIGIQYVISWLEVRFEWFQKIIKARPAVLFKEGEFREKTIKSERISKVEVLAAMRYAHVTDPSQVAYVLLETDGQISVLPKPDVPTSYGVLKPVESFSPKNNGNH